LKKKENQVGREKKSREGRTEVPPKNSREPEKGG